ncbi:MAG: methyl-accepting chemotaxis protein [Desulfococcaceae bacterium]
MIRNQEDLNHSHQIRYESYLAADELRQSSDDLTRMARTYAASGKSDYENIYKDILAIRRGEKARPKNYEYIYWDLVLAYGEKPKPDGTVLSLRDKMKSLGFTHEEFTKLDEAKNKSDELVKIETIAMNAVKGIYDDGTGKFAKKGEPDRNMAITMMHDDKYHGYKARIMKPIDDFFQMFSDRTKARVDLLMKKGHIYLWTIFAAISVLLIFSIASVYIIQNRISRPVFDAVKKLDEISENIKNASQQIYVSGQNLSGDSLRQASALEESSSSLEEMSSMTKKNAHDADRVNLLMKETKQFAEQADKGMSDLTQVMSVIFGDSKETQKIVKTIDEIAFHTNMLALNAAVEAARAGEAGAGFSVVAQEVKNLAAKSAESAKNTADLIENTVIKIKQGFDFVTETDKVFTKVSEGSFKAAEFIDGIAASSKELAHGIEQINTAVSELDTIAQQNAASSEDSASVSRHLSDESEQLGKVVCDLIKLIGVAGSRKLQN